MRGSHSALIRVAVITALGLVAAACTTWKTQSASPADVLAKETPRELRVNLADGSTVALVRPAIAGDTLEGLSARDSTKRIAVPLSDVRSVAVQKVHAGKTVLLVAGLGLTAAVVIAAATYDGPFGDSHSSGGGSGDPVVSCPLVYSWDGTRWRLDSGTFGGAIAPALARTDVDNLLYAVPQGDVLRLRVANELEETDYLDALSVLAVDHDPGSTVAPDGQGRIHTLGSLQAPATARDFRGADALDRVRLADGWGWESNPSGRDPAVDADVRDGLELVFPNPGVRRARLVLDGNSTPWAAHLMREFIDAHGRETQAWYDSLEAHPELARRLGAMMAEEAFLGVSVWSQGRWQPQGFIWEAGPEIVKRQVIMLDLSRVEGDSLRIRLESAPSFWLIDLVALDFSSPAQPSVLELWPESGLDSAGADVAGLIRERDGRHYIMENGAAAELRFRVPPVPAGRSRSYLARSTGWYRIHSPEAGEPDVALLHEVMTQRHGASRAAVARFNRAMLALGTAR